MELFQYRSAQPYIVTTLFVTGLDYTVNINNVQYGTWFNSQIGVQLKMLMRMVVKLFDHMT